MPRDSAAADRPASYLVGTAAAFPLFFRDRTKPINQLTFSPSAKFPKSGSSCESRVNEKLRSEITEHARAEARLQELQSELFHAARLSSMGQMAGAFAHELNQPLGAA